MGTTNYLFQDPFTAQLAALEAMPNLSTSTTNTNVSSLLSSGASSIGNFFTSTQGMIVAGLGIAVILIAVTKKR